MVAYSYDLQFGASLNYPVSFLVRLGYSVGLCLKTKTNYQKEGTKSHGDALEA